MESPEAPSPEQEAKSGPPHEGGWGRRLRLPAMVGGLAVLVVLVALWWVRRGTGPLGPPPLPGGCSWVTEAAPECPAADARAYQAWVKRNGPLTIRQDRSGIELVWVPGGAFRMGSKEGCKDEEPAHRVELDGFWIGRTEVTVKQWRAVTGSVLGPDNDQGEDHPIVDVSWEECGKFGQKAGLALPTEAQWEYAARGPEGSEYPWGDWWAATLCRSAETRRRHSKTAPVGSFPKGASWCGALDMAGNVAEWCRDWYDKGFYETREARHRNPECTDKQSGNRVLRGGSWFNYADTCRSAARAFNFPWLQDFDVGVRVVLTR
ncbi:MAG: formylglycine-generating enzyme family protein [Armatimonadetes bacterium]|nr:formylglycine-generating enzyme family protein [Armatimonadota bacterium]